MFIKEANMGIDWGNIGIDRTCEQLWKFSTFSCCIGYVVNTQIGRGGVHTVCSNMVSLTVTMC